MQVTRLERTRGADHYTGWHMAHVGACRWCCLIPTRVVDVGAGCIKTTVERLVVSRIRQEARR
jgi:hypothetical protein